MDLAVVYFFPNVNAQNEVENTMARLLQAFSGRGCPLCRQRHLSNIFSLSISNPNPIPNPKP